LHSCYLFELFEVDDRAIHELVEDLVHAMVEASVFGSEDEEADGLTRGFATFLAILGFGDFSVLWQFGS
jgi:hypothetical protein